MATTQKKKIKRPLTILGVKPVDLENYIKFAEDKDVINLDIQEHGVEVIIERGSVVSPAPIISQQPVTETVTSVSEPTTEEVVDETTASEKVDEYDSKYTKVTSPIVGTFYEAPSPTSDPFVKVGDIVEKGQTLCIVEAMKVMNKINSEVKGKIVKVIPENAQPVNQGDVLFLIEPV